jgi:DNA-binding beta-propeller fold protein YncE
MHRGIAGLAVAMLLVGVPATGADAAGPGPAAVRAAAGRGGPVYVTNIDSDNVSEFMLTDAGTLAPAGRPVASGTAPRGMVFTPDGRHAYVVDNGSNQITTYAVGDNGALSARLPATATQGNSPFGIAIAPDGKTLYVTDQSPAAVERFTVGADGALTPLGAPVRAAAFPRGIAVAPSGRFVYLSHGDPATGAPGLVTAFAVHGGALEPIGTPQPAGTAGALMTITPDGRYLYADSQNFGSPSDPEGVYGFRIGADGRLHPLPGSPVAAGAGPTGPEGIAVTPDGRHLYVASDALWGFTIGAGGTLSPVPGARFDTGPQTVAVTSSSDGRHVFATEFGSSQVFAFTVNADGSLRAAGPPIPTGGTAPGFQSIAVPPGQDCPAPVFTGQTPLCSSR